MPRKSAPDMPKIHARMERLKQRFERTIQRHTEAMHRHESAIHAAAQQFERDIQALLPMDFDRAAGGLHSFSIPPKPDEPIPPKPPRRRPPPKRPDAGPGGVPVGPNHPNTLSGGAAAAAEPDA